MQIRDLVMTFHQKRREYRLMYEFRAAGGQMPPIHDGYQGEALRKKLTREYEQGTTLRFKVFSGGFKVFSGFLKVSDKA